jgi:hypothetical protein
MRIEWMEPRQDWDTIWSNMWMAPIPSQVRALWYKIVHDIIPTNTCLHAIGISPIDICRICAARDTLTHRLVECGQAPEQWDWMAGRIARLLYMDKKWMQATWILRKFFSLWPAKRHWAVLWVVAHYAVFRTRTTGDLTNADYISYLQEALSIILYISSLNKAI